VYFILEVYSTYSVSHVASLPSSLVPVLWTMQLPQGRAINPRAATLLARTHKLYGTHISICLKAKRSLASLVSGSVRRKGVAMLGRHLRWWRRSKHF
jgi:hypothetical protein